MKSACGIVCVLLLAGVSGVAWGQELTQEEFLKNPEMAKSVALIGQCFLNLGYAGKSAEARQQLKSNYWACKPDSGLTGVQVGVEEARFQHAVDQIAKIVDKRGIDELKFAGLDLVCLVDCQNWYFAAFTPSGPVLIRVHVLFKNGARIFGMTVFTDWDVIRQVATDIQIKPAATVLTIKRKATPQAQPAP